MKLRAAAVVVALVGLGIATYLTIVHYAGSSPVCAIAHGCATVQKSDYAKLAGIPVAVLGVIGYLGILACLVRDSEATRTAAAFLAIGGLGFSGWLTYVEVAKIDAICIWCVGSAICMALLAGLTIARVLTSPPELAQVR
ncbi:MAG TPA: vitamin K epoxide reductase family protein [Solirubrobacter sp.]|nr:vitamin K epoxide reductase family protein [Solirubrobacter sp.]